MSNEEVKTRRTVLTNALGVAAVAGVAAFTNFGTGTTPTMAGERRWDREKVKRAIASLEEARDELKAADRDFHGHKEEALASLEHSLHQLHVILENE
jgi:hypothetical protein